MAVIKDRIQQAKGKMQDMDADAKLKAGDTVGGMGEKVKGKWNQAMGDLKVNMHRNDNRR